MSLSSALSDVSEMSLADLQNLQEQVQARIVEVRRENVDERIAEFKKSSEFKSLVKRMRATAEKGDKLDNIEVELHADLVLNLSVTTKDHMSNVLDGCCDGDDLFEVSLCGEIKGRLPAGVKETLQQAVNRYTEDACEDLWNLFPALKVKVENVETEVANINTEISDALANHDLEFDDVFGGVFE